jgi:dual specificity phosphatase 12
LDSPEVNLAKFFNETNKFIDEAVSENPDAKILIHCFAGISRSSTVLSANLISRQGMTCEQAIAKIRETRHQANPNSGIFLGVKE